VIQVAPTGARIPPVPAVAFRPATETEIDAMKAKWSKGRPVHSMEDNLNDLPQPPHLP